MRNERIRIVLVDDHELVRQSWKMLLENNPRLEVVADFENGQAVIDQVQKISPDIILVDINMSPENGFVITEKLMGLIPSLKIIGLSANNQPKYASRMIEVGARGYLTKTSSLEEINQGIIEVYEGRLYICDEIKKHMPSS
ncbi:hypothetical protein CAP36_02890 [Chitinophagaceae bacterium IBVUCB2]|nr:hypothetical protein CAP36_02890 [Chitinophagaceae bacterium IBVUCB2]